MLGLLVVAAVSWGQGGEDKATPAAPGGETMIRDPNWQPKPGDRAVIDLKGAPAAATMDVWGRVVDPLTAGDRVGVKPFLDSGELVRLDQGTPVLVVKRHDFRPPVQAGVITTIEGYDRAMRVAALNPPGPKADPPPNLLELRVLDGPYKDQARVVREADVAVMIPAPYVGILKLKRGKPTPAKVDASARAVSLLGSARNLERAGKASAALEWYRKVAAEFPGTPQAAEAAARVKALGSK